MASKVTFCKQAFSIHDSIATSADDTGESETSKQQEDTEGNN